MSKNNDFGKEAEAQAVNFLRNKKYEILHTNYRCGHKEVDIICKNNGVLVFVEVKYRSYDSFGFPEEFVDERKKEHLRVAANFYVNQLTELTPIRFDIIAVTPKKQADTGQFAFKHFVDAFF